MKFICSVFPTQFVVAGIDERSLLADLDTFHFSFAVFGIEPEDFCKAIDKVITNSKDAETYWNFDDIPLGEHNQRNTIRITRDCMTVSITRGNVKVLYHGAVNSLIGLSDAIMQAAKEMEDSLE